MKKLNVFPLAVTDAENTFKYLQEEDLYRFIPDKKYHDVAQLKARYQMLINGSQHDHEIWLNWIIYQDENKKIPIGTLQSTILMQEKKAYVGYVIFKDFWNQGYGRLALGWLIQHLKSNVNIEYLEGYVDARNQYSIKILEHHHFHKIGIDGTDLIYRRYLNC